MVDTRKRDFGFFFHLVVETDLSEKKVVFSFVSGNTVNALLLEKTHTKSCFICEENAERTRERERETWKRGFCRREEEEEIRSFLILSFFLLIMSDKEDVSRRPALTNPMATNYAPLVNVISFVRSKAKAR